jgi:hypothetical protein
MDYSGAGKEVSLTPEIMYAAVVQLHMLLLPTRSYRTHPIKLALTAFMLP